MMAHLTLFEKGTEKAVDDTVKTISENAGEYGFIVRDVFNMGEEFQSHGVEVDKDFLFYSVMLCNPRKAYQSIKENPIRGAVLLPPKQVTVYKDKQGNTRIAYLAFEKEIVEKLVPGDDKFTQGLPDSCKRIVQLIESSV